MDAQRKLAAWRRVGCRPSASRAWVWVWQRCFQYEQILELIQGRSGAKVRNYLEVPISKGVNTTHGPDGQQVKENLRKLANGASSSLPGSGLS